MIAQQIGREASVALSIGGVTTKWATTTSGSEAKLTKWIKEEKREPKNDEVRILPLAFAKQ
ncbi:MAG: hypothetical protein R3F28_13965 [Candidatus Kapaibacterium sp.]